jgi:uncharacterized protein YcaQ
MDEFESQRFLDALQQHAQLAHARQYAYFLPLLESMHDVAVVDSKVDATSVQLTVRELFPASSNLPVAFAWNHHIKSFPLHSSGLKRILLTNETFLLSARCPCR